MGDSGDIKFWESKLVGKVYTEDENNVSAEMVSVNSLPKNHRVLLPSTFATMDFQPERLSVHLDEDNRVSKVQFG